MLLDTMQMPKVFPCSKCGECCRHIDLVPQLAHFDRGDGVCMHIYGNLCGIYAERPEICCVDKMYEKYFSDLYTREAFYKLNLAACQELREKIHNSMVT